MISRSALRGAGLLGAVRRHSGVLLALVFIVGVTLASWLAPLPYNPRSPNAYATLAAPSVKHWFGTDEDGFDVFSRTIYAARTDVTLALGGAALAAVVGVPLGLIASTGRRSARVVARALDIFQSFPLLVLTIVIVALLGASAFNLLVVIAAVNTPAFIRIVRSDALTVRSTRYIEAAIGIGASRVRVTFRHLLPNVLPTVLQQLALAIGSGIISIAALTFLGLGLGPSQPAWGAMIRDGATQIATGAWWVAFFPGLMILLFILSINLLADATDRFLKPER